jgi:Domain of unknown function (DUF1772)
MTINFSTSFAATVRSFRASIPGERETIGCDRTCLLLRLPAPFSAPRFTNRQQPARLSLDARSMIREWMPSDRRGFVMLAMLAIVAAFSAYVQYIRSGDVHWLIGGSIILASWPYAYFVIIPVNNLLHGIRNVPASMERVPAQ